MGRSYLDLWGRVVGVYANLGGFGGPVSQIYSIRMIVSGIVRLAIHQDPRAEESVSAG